MIGGLISVILESLKQHMLQALSREIIPTDNGSCQAIYVPIFNRLGMAFGSAYCQGNTSVSNAMVFRR